MLEIRESLNEANIDIDIQNSLIEKLMNGQIWDCMDKEKTSQIPEDYFNISLEDPIKRYTFPDGSFIEHKIELCGEIELVEPSRFLRGISGGTIESGSGYAILRNVKVSKMSGSLLGMGFYADYTFVQGMRDQIDDVYSRWVKIVGGSYSVDTFEITRQYEDVSGNKPATAKLIADIQWAGGIVASGTELLYLYVGGDNAWTYSN